MRAVDAFLDAYRGFKVLRVWPYVMWRGTGWGTVPTVETIRAFLDYVCSRGFFVELTLLTDDDPSRILEARQLVEALSVDPPANLLIEIGNEPTTHKNIDTAALRSVLTASPFLFASGDYEDSHRWFGRYLTAHTPRDAEWPRKAHDLLEYYGGGGPSAPSDPPHNVPCIADEPIRPDQAGYVETDFYAYAAVCSILGAGATFHFENGKQADVPTADEARCAVAFRRGLTAFPADAPISGAYRRADDASLRSYVVGPYMVRVRPTGPEAPESGWVPLDEWGIAWRRA